ncbi:MAG: hypothetical protein ACK4PG_04570 [Acetobacteraceae bacterium]
MTTLPDLSGHAPLLQERDLDRIAALAHNLLLEVASLSERVAALEARLEGAPAPTREQVAARVAALIDRAVEG